MYLVPYIHKQVDCGSFQFHAIQVFLADGGTSFWKTEEARPSIASLEKEYCEENGIFLEKIDLSGEFAFARIHTSKTRISDFYKWTETKEEGWRTISFFVDNSNKLISPESLEGIYIGTRSAVFLCSEVLRLVS